ncbi:iron-containing alcohol dehydrogenase [Rhodobacteraceae bacterium B1Z28]|uniref:Iron-containing alcohol dehydrogenase n=1 Tax=Ruegeria haliotis TaxID=2747601 RepID=A0ABX2PRC1_9RHOB|nr:iron-containing alcohol dehydrogenase [Ruegeria haliotis]NVO56665.1 iron-containing alcohol dehydrogenase [Ruegeria haliotis]
MNLLAPQDWTFPVPIAYGPGRLMEIAEFCKSANMTSPLIITDKGSADLPFVADLRKYLKQGGLRAGLYFDISPNPRDDEIAAGRAQYRNNGHDGIIALGGGSGMDGAKAVCLVANNEINLWEFDLDKSPPNMTGHPSFPPLICIPTTAGTGAETESTAMITQTARKMKLCVWHPDLKPSLALLDPELTLGLPPHLTAWTGADAMVHAIEAYCVPMFHPLCDGAALESLRLAYRWLPIAVAEPENTEARGAMLVASCLGGIAFLKGLGLVHAISHMVGAEYNTQHGLTNAIILPAALSFNAPDIQDKIKPMAQAMGLEDTSFDAFHSAICELLDQLGIPTRLTEIDVPTDKTGVIAARARLDIAATTNPRPLTEEDIEEVLHRALTTGRPSERAI